MANKNEYDEYHDDELFAIGTYKARYITKKVNIPFDITVGVTIHKVILWVKATGGGRNIECKRTNSPADQYTEVFPSG
ncbi:hypothetical protein BGT96224_Ac30982 [Blumeria graminis f. sp. tritici 96224]|nr:BgtAc-30982 [Blumeria graminis f. sp. tritici]EPQ62946.1 hypothetical protein BGT96224_Ac30982 [Blumeria graminis f. sp. tritici 96224]